jgi:penicillin-binding protein 1B
VEQGGSTLTQQLVKNFFLSNERSLQRKLSEALVSILLELHFSKQEILETYLNEVYLGQSGPRAIHGFGLASRYYFNVSLDQLKLHQQALLVGLVKGPSYYDPWRFPQRSLDRRNLVLDMMLEQGLVSASEAAKAKQAPISVGEKVSRHRATYPAYLDLVRRQLRREYRERDLSSDGLSIFTHFDPLLQWQAERSTAATFARLQQRYGKDRVDPIEAGMIVTSIDSGDVQAVIGGKDIRFPGFNRAIDALRPVGSLMKPAVYLTALSHPDRYSLMTPLSDASVTVKGQDGSVWQPRNFDKKDHGNVPLHRAMSQSLNQATARLGMELGIDAVLDTVKKLGVERSLPEVPSVVLGAAEMTVFDVAGMFQTIAGGGFHSRLNTIHEVLDAKGVALSRYPLEVEQRISPKANYLLQYILQEVMREGTGKKVYRHFPEQYALAGKTGTSDDLRDSWFAGFNGEQLAVVWMGRDDNGSTPVTGASGALLLWQDYFLSQPQESVLQRVPDGVTYHWVDGERMLLSKSHCEGARYMPFIDGTEPSAIAECQSRATDLWQWFRSLLD